MKYMKGLITRICDQFGPRAPCSIAEREAGLYIEVELGKYCDKTAREGFECAPMSFLGWIRYSVVMSIGALLLFWLDAWVGLGPVPWAPFVSTGLSVFAFLLFWEQFVRYRQTFDWMFKKNRSENIIGTLNPDDDAKLVLFTAHHDSALQFNVLEKAPRVYVLTIGSGMAGLLFLTVFMPFWLVVTLVPGFELDMTFSIMGFILLGLVPVLVTLFFFVSPSVAVPGAIDNLSGVAVVIGLARRLRELEAAGRLAPGIECKFISFGCEEAGLRGSKAYVKEHQSELLQREALVVNLEMLMREKNVNVVTAELQTRTRHSEGLTDLFLTAAGKASEGLGFTSTSISVPPGGGATDAVPFSHAGIKAISIMGCIPQEELAHYHNQRDVPDAIEPGALLAAMRSCEQLVSELGEKERANSCPR